MASRPCTVLNFTTPSTVHQKPWKGVQQRGQLSRVNGTIKMQLALNIQTNAKSDPFPNLLFFYKIVATGKQLLTPVLRFNNCQATKSGSTSRLDSVISSLLVVLMLIFLKETTYIVPPGSWESSYSQPGPGDSWKSPKVRLHQSQSTSV